MKIHVIGAHNCESRDSKFISLLIDDVLAIDAGGLASGLTFQDQQKLKAILITHQHYDHIRDIPAIAMNLFFQGATINVYSTQTVLDALAIHLLNGTIYPKFQTLPDTNPTIKFRLVEPYKPERIEGYGVLPIPVNHENYTVGYQVTGPDGKVLFYTADSGPGLTDCWKHVSPQLLIVEVTVPNRCEQFAVQTGHLTPALLKQELTDFQELKGHLPPVVVVHMQPGWEDEIAAEIEALAGFLNTPITLAYEGMELDL
jgi:cAMP phosphodiesterase